jgi:hypothetical protein
VIRLHQEVLSIDAGFGVINQEQARPKSIKSCDQRVEPVDVGFAFHPFIDVGCFPCMRYLPNRDRRLLWIIQRSAGTANNYRHQ